MQSEIAPMYTNSLWTLVNPPEGIKPIGCKWIYKRKRDGDGNVETFKARRLQKDIFKSKVLTMRKLFHQ